MENALSLIFFHLWMTIIKAILMVSGDMFREKIFVIPFDLYPKSMISICASIKANSLNAKTQLNASGVTLKMQRCGRYVKCLDWMLSKYNIGSLQQL